MRFPLGKPVPYDATAQRPQYDTLPETVRDDISAHLGGKPVRVNLAGGGFTGGFAGMLTSADGRSMFVKAAGPDTRTVVEAYAAEATVHPKLPPQTPAPRMLFASAVGDWVVLGFEPVHGKAARLPLRPDELDVMLRAWTETSEALTPAPQSLVDIGLPRFIDTVDDIFANFTAVTAGHGPVPPLGELRDRLDELAELEQDMKTAVDADAIHHGDLRPDNMILTPQRAWICDWNHPAIGACWFDTLSFLVVAHGDGHDAETLARQHSSLRGVSDEQIDAVLAAITGYYLCNSMQPPIPHISGYLRTHQRWNGLAALDWIASRRGW